MAFNNSSSDLINIRSFINDWANLLENTNTGIQPKSDDFHALIKKELCISEEMATELNSVCSVDALDCVDDHTTVDILLKTIPDDLTLKTTSCQKAELEKRKDYKYRQKILRSMKYKRQNAPWLHPTKEVRTAADVSTETHDVIITVQIFRPYHKRISHRHPVLNEEFEVVGHQHLSSLRDVITCPADAVVPANHSQQPDEVHETAKELYKSASLFIENVFYNDLRHADCIEYSRGIIEWASDRRRGLGAYTTADMHNTCFNDLAIRLGQPYVYLHQGNCEHLVVFSEIRLTPALSADGYPLLVTNRKERRLNYCRVCMRFRPRWLTYDSPLSPEDPSFFCDTCFRMLHYDAEGNLMFDFKAHPINADP